MSTDDRDLTTDAPDYEPPRLETLGSIEDLTLDGPGISLSIILP